MVRYMSTDKPFNTEYPTWIIAYCPDTSSFFATNQRCFFWQFENEFNTEKEAIEYFIENVSFFVNVETKIMTEMIYNYQPYNSAYLENTNKKYEIK